MTQMTGKREKSSAMAKLLESSITETIQLSLGSVVYGALSPFLHMSDYPYRPGLFDKDLRAFFGGTAAVIEIMAVKDMCRKTGLPYYPAEPFSFEAWCKEIEAHLAKMKGGS